jgi:hypothetical protein
VDYLYSLYDALVSINVPNDKARAVVDAMERDMASTIATKTDLQLLRQELLTGMAALATRDDFQAVKADIVVLRHDVGLLQQDVVILKQDSATLKHDVATMKQDVGVLKQDVGTLKQDVATLKQDVGVLKQDVVLIRKDMDVMSSRIVVQLGSMLVVGLTVLFAALKFS